MEFVGIFGAVPFLINISPCCLEVSLEPRGVQSSANKAEGGPTGCRGGLNLPHRGVSRGERRCPARCHRHTHTPARGQGRGPAGWRKCSFSRALRCSGLRCVWQSEESCGGPCSVRSVTDAVVSETVVPPDCSLSGVPACRGGLIASSVLLNYLFLFAIPGLGF